jgi:hypothetical protein
MFPASAYPPALYPTPLFPGAGRNLPDAMPVLLPGSLIALDRAVAALPNLRDDQLGTVPALIAAASRAAENYCNRHFLAADYDEEYDGNGFGSLLLKQFPVNRVDRLMTSPRPVLAVANVDRARVAIASAALATAVAAPAGRDDPLPASALLLRAFRDGVPDPDATLPFSAHPTLNDLAAAVNALGGGWTATVPDPSTYGRWPTAWLRAPQGAYNAAGGAQARFTLHTLPLANYQLDAATGEVRFGSEDTYGPLEGFGPYFYVDPDPFVLRGPKAIRVLYNAGFRAVPDDVQQAVALICQKMFDDDNTSQVYESEKLGDYEYRRSTTRFTLTSLPAAALNILNFYKDWRGE